jgi:competence ComEA-like helix-hairpin-helix protein
MHCDSGGRILTNAATAGTRGSILVGLLWCLALLSLIVVGILHTSRIDLLAVKNYGDKIQAHYLAVAGIEKARALLYQNAHDRSRSSRNHSGELYDAPDQFRDVNFGRGLFRVFRRGRPDEGGGIIYGIGDEESRLNVNVATLTALTNLDGMTPEIASSIADWRDGDNEVTPGGAELDYYLSQQPPYQPRNAPFVSVRELLMVKGVTRELLFGRDTHGNGMLPQTGEGESDDAFNDRLAGGTDTGWAGRLTICSSVKNISASGEDRVNVQTADENALTAVKGITSSIARAMVAYRGQNKFQSIGDLLDVTPPARNNSGGNSGRNNSGGSNRGNQSQSNNDDLSDNSGSGTKVISQTLLMDIADQISVVDASQDLAGAININTAGADVLRCLPGIDRDLAQAIISYRQSSGYFANVAELLKVGGITEAVFKQVAPLVTARSETFRILCEGRISSTGARQRIEAIVHVGLNDASTLAWREDDL